MAKTKKMFYVVVYDIEKDRTRLKVSKILEKYGMRVNYSVFECMFTESQLDKVWEQTGSLIDLRSDTVIYYRVCIDCYTKIIYQPLKRKVFNLVAVV